MGNRAVQLTLTVQEVQNFVLYILTLTTSLSPICSSQEQRCVVAQLQKLNSNPKSWREFMSTFNIQGLAGCYKIHILLLQRLPICLSPVFTPFCQHDNLQSCLAAGFPQHMNASHRQTFQPMHYNTTITQQKDAVFFVMD